MGAVLGIAAQVLGRITDCHGFHGGLFDEALVDDLADENLLRGIGRLLGWQIVNVPGATGYIGGRLIRPLEATGRPLRLMVRLILVFTGPRIFSTA